MTLPETIDQLRVEANRIATETAEKYSELFRVEAEKILARLESQLEKIDA